MILPPILRADIEEAQRHTNSNLQAARYLGVSFRRYKKYAELYGIYERHLNKSGVGIDKGFSKAPTSIPLREILAGQHPTYSRRKLKNRLIARGKLKEQCTLCGFHERRVSDGMVPLILSFKDGDKHHMALENLELLCYNCIFLTQGAPNVIYKTTLEKVMHGQKITRITQQPPITTADHYDPDPDDPTQDMVLTDEERDELLNDL